MRWHNERDSQRIHAEGVLELCRTVARISIGKRQHEQYREAKYTQKIKDHLATTPYSNNRQEKQIGKHMVKMTAI